MASFVLVDNVDLKILKGAKSVKQLECWADLVCKKNDFLILSTVERRQWSVYNIAELALIYAKTKGTAAPLGDFSSVLRATVDLAREVEEDPTTFEQLVKKLKGNAPVMTTMPAQRDRSPNPEKDPKAMAEAEARRAQAHAQAVTRAANASPEQRPARGKAAASPPPTRPKGGITGQVWSICDIHEKGGKTGKELRAAIIAACTAAGIDPSTAATQYSKWNRRAREEG